MARAKQADMAFLAEILRKTGVNTDPDTAAIMDIRADLDKARDRETQAARAQMGVLRMHHKPHSMMAKKCQCGKVFMTAYCFQDWCTAECYEAEWTRLHGIAWDDLMSQVNPPPSDWQYEPHPSVTPEQFERLLWLSQKIVDDAERFRSQISQTHPNSPTPGLDRLFEQWGVEPEDETTPHTPGPVPESASANAQENQEASKLESDPSDLDLSEFYA